MAEFSIGTSALQEDWMRAARLKKLADEGDKDAARELAELEKAEGGELPAEFFEAVRKDIERRSRPCKDTRKLCGSSLLTDFFRSSRTNSVKKVKSPSGQGRAVALKSFSNATASTRNHRTTRRRLPLGCAY
jgi:hypothetical protein